ncbi:MAG: HAMP domain-containing histidine kinase [Acetatifactor sp.]|nr:HAMP domain-containing histidine kinase [Acetatifactor sp.]
MKNEKRMSLYLELFLLLFLAGMISLLFFVGSRFVIEQQIDIYHQDKNIVQKYNEKYISQIQKFITERGISTKDLWKLNEWMNNNRLIYIQIKKGNEWIYSSDFAMDEEQADVYDFLLYPSDSYYDIELSDGTAQVFIMGMYSYNAYMVALIFAIIVSFLLFFVLTMFGIRRKILYINQLSRDIEILEGGNLEYEVHMQGNDEIADLAAGLNSMKASFKNQIEEIERLTRTNQEMVTEISHDLRTPLTSVLLYAEILLGGKYAEEKNKQEYLNKIIKKIQHMKDLSDRLLAYSVHSMEEKYIPAGYVPLHSALYDELSDMCSYLSEQGLKVKENLRWEEGDVFIYGEYLTRILDNISSNILKYADAQALVLIWDEYYEDEIWITFENACGRGNSGMDSYSIGIRNVKMMMEEMGGNCEVVQSKEQFRICLRFRYRKNDGKMQTVS